MLITVRTIRRILVHAILSLAVVSLPYLDVAADNGDESKETVSKDTVQTTSENPSEGAKTAATFTPLTALTLAVAFDKSFLSLPAIERDTDRLDTICERFGEQLKEGVGPWGFGLFKEITDCRKTGETSVGRDFSIWTLKIALTTDAGAEITLCRPVPGRQNGEKCEATVTVPGGEFLVESFEEPKFVRLVAAALLDAAPFRSKLTANLVDAAGKTAAEKPPAEKKVSLLQLPDYPSPLKPASAQIDENSGLFKVKLIKNEELKTLVQENRTWIVTAKRGKMNASMTRQITATRLFLETFFARKKERQEKSALVVGRPEREAAKSGLPWRQRFDNSLELRGGGATILNGTYTYNADIEFSMAQGIAQNLWFEGHFLSGKYKIATEVESSDLGNTTIKSVTTRRVMNASLGWGLRLVSASDFLFFLYPKVGATYFIWKPNPLDIDELSSKTDASFSTTLFPALGATLGFASPESWPIELRTRIIADAIGNRQFSTYGGDVSATFGVPEFMKTMHASLGAERGGFTAFAAGTVTLINSSSSKSKYIKNVGVNILDVIFGGGYFLAWY